jgi:hypothetical protein
LAGIGPLSLARTVITDDALPEDALALLREEVDDVVAVPVPQRAVQ